MTAKSGIEVARLFMEQTTLNDDGSGSRPLSVKQMSWLLSDSSIALKGDATRYTFEMDAKFEGIYKGVLWPDGTGSIQRIPVKTDCAGLDTLWPLFKTATKAYQAVQAGEEVIQHLSTCNLGHKVMYAKASEDKPWSEGDIPVDSDLSEALPEASEEAGESEGTPEGDPVEFDDLVEEIANSN